MPMPTAHSHSPAYKPNNPPQLHGTSMEALREYFMRLDFYNRRIARTPITSDYNKIEGAGMGLQVFALKTWFTQGLSKHLAKPYTQFKSERGVGFLTGGGDLFQGGESVRRAPYYGPQALEIEIVPT